MKQDEELWMKKMREALKDYSEPAPPGGWEQLERRLKPSVEKRMYLYKWWAAAAAVLVLAVSAVSLFFMKSPAADDIRYTTTPTLATAPDVMPDPSIPEIFSGVTETARPAAKRSGVLAYVADNPDKNERVETIEPAQEAGERVVDVIPERNEVTDTNPVAGESTNERKIARPSGRDKLHIPADAEKKPSSKGKWSVSASVGNATTTSGDLTDTYYTQNAPNQMVDFGSSLDGGVVSIPRGHDLIFNNGVPYVAEQAYPEEFDHKLPVSVGLSVRKGLSNGFSVETGLTYTLLSSEAKKGSKTIDQKLHYIGIPVRANWNFIDSERLTLYVSAGGAVEKCVYGKLDGEKLTVNPLQLSVTGAVGAQFNVSKHVGIYVEPGVGYFFDDGSDVETIRKDRPLNFNLQAGIRLTY